MIKFQDTSVNATLELKSKVMKLLPKGVPTLIVSLEEKIDNGFSSLLRLAINNKESAMKWVEEFEQISSTKHRVNGTFAENTQKIVFKKRYHCYRNTRATYTRTKSPHPRHTDCSAKLCVTIKQSNMPKSKDKYLKKYPCEIDIRFVHNHDYGPENSTTRVKKTVDVLGDNKNTLCSMQNERLKPTNTLSDENDFPSSIYAEKILSSDTDLELIIELENVFTFLKDNLLNYPEIFGTPLRQFIENVDKISSSTDLASALNNFGKCNITKQPLVVIEKDNRLQDSDNRNNKSKYHSPEKKLCSTGNTTQDENVSLKLIQKQRCKRKLSESSFTD